LLMPIIIGFRTFDVIHSDIVRPIRFRPFSVLKIRTTTVDCDVYQKLKILVNIKMWFTTGSIRVSICVVSLFLHETDCYETITKN